MVERLVYLALGSNLGDRLGYLQLAYQNLPSVTRASQVYETEPVGGPEKQGPYLNAVVELNTALSARRLLTVAHQLEQAAGRVRIERNGPRTLDVDILCIEGETIDELDLTVPHPRMWERRFVLAPLGELAPELLPDDWESRATGQVWAIGPLLQQLQ